jgi:hypothetical protein
MAKKKPKPPKAKPGPKPDLLKIEGNWEDAVAKSLKKKKPPGGWPKK